MRAVAELPEEAIYDTDFYAWTQQQAELLRRLRATGASLLEDMDLDHIAEEIEDMGKSHLQTVGSLASNVLVHILKYVSAREAPAAKHWRSEGEGFLLDIEEKFTPSMRQRIDMQKAWRRARRLARVQLDEYGDKLVEYLPTTCPFSIGDLIADGTDFDMLAAHIIALEDKPMRG